MCSHVLSPEQIQRIHQASLAILKRVGVTVPHAVLLGRFADAGTLAQENAEILGEHQRPAVAGSADALNMTGAYRDDSELREEAELTADKLMDELKHKNPAEMKTLAGKLQASKNAALADKTKKILEEIK